MSWVFRMVLVVAAGALLVTATVAAMAPRVWRIANAHEEVPVQLPEFAALAQSSVVYDATGREIAVYQLENSQAVSLADVPEHVVDAFLAVEDNEFWQHHGVNVRGLFRATLSNLSADGQVQGASTITMQVVKNDYLAGFERDGRYKALQITYAVRLEKERSKDEILERYFNTVFFGQNSYGLGAAAETYFGKSVGQLTLTEGAFLAGLVQAPTTYDPILNPERSRNRFGQVLDRLVAVELITEDERETVAEEFVIPERVLRRAERATRRTYYTEALRDYLLNRSDILGATYDERYRQLFRGGLRIHTTLDPDLQLAAERARDELPDNSLGIDAAITSVDSRTGAIKAMVGGSGFVPGQNEVNLALAPSQTGSSIKMFMLVAALQAGATPEDIIDGTHPCTLPDPGNPAEPTFVTRGGVNGGVDTLRRHTVRSINCAYLRLSQIVGLNRVVDTVYRTAGSPYLYVGQPASEREPILPYGSMATGANELSTLDMAAGIQSIANLGVHHEPYFVEAIDSAEGERIYTHSDEGVRVLDEQVALTAIDVLEGVLTGGTARRELAEFAAARPAFGKTGTQDSNVTAFFVGATPELSTAVMVRDPDLYTPMRGIPEFSEAGVDRVQGGTFPARIWRTYMEQTGLDQFEFTGWAEPEPPERRAARLYLPGNECLYEIVRYEPGEVLGTDTIPPGEDGAAGDGGDGPTGLRSGMTTRPAAPPEPPPTETTAPPAEPPPTATTAPPPTVVITAPPRPVFGRVESGTTIPADVLDPDAPLPSTPLNMVVRGC